LRIEPEQIADVLREAYRKGKTHGIIVVAEGAKYNATQLDEYFTAHKEQLEFDLRVTIIGHVQRGGTPSAYDRILASRLGAGATEQIRKGNFGVLVGTIKSETVATPLDEVVNTKKVLDPKMIELARILD